MLTKRLSNANLLLLGLLASPLAAAELTLLDQVSAPTGVVRLGDVAEIVADTQAEVERLARLPLMPAPAPGTPASITPRGVRDLLEASGVDPNTLRITGAQRVVIGNVRAAAHTVRLEPKKRTFAELVPSLDAWAKQHRSNQTGFRRGATATATVAGNPWTRSPQARKSNVSSNKAKRLRAELLSQIVAYARQQSGEPMADAHSLEIEDRQLVLLSEAATPLNLTTTASLAAGRQRFLVSFDTEQGEVRFPVFAELYRARPAVFALRPVPRGAVITRADVEVRPLPLDARAPTGGALFEVVDQVVGQEAGRQIRVGDILTDANCLPPLLVRRGEEVAILAGGDGIRIRMTGVAKANGRLGEIVSVETFNSREQLSARVVARRELAVLSGGVGGFSTAALPRRVR